MKKMISLAIAAMLALGMSTTALAADINVSVEGKPVVWTDAKPFVNKDGRTMVPLRPIANALGLHVEWNAELNEAVFSKDNQEIYFAIGADVCPYYINNWLSWVHMDTAACVINGRTYAPAKYLAEAFDYSVGWDQATKSVTITKDVPVTLDLSAAPKTAAEVATPKDAMALALAELQDTVFLSFGCSSGEVNNTIQDITVPLLAGTPYELTVSHGGFAESWDAWECKLTMTNTETKESFRMVHAFIPVQFYPEG